MSAIRPLRPEDRAAWLPLWQGYQRFYEVELPEAVTATTWARLLDPREPVWGALAVEGDAALGLVHYIFHRSTWSEGAVCYLNDLFVADAARGRGLARQLIEHVYEAAQLAGCAKVYWLTHETNATAQALYDKVAERSGFIQYRKTL
ncbi:GNAT family N-acetyltransferase [Ancylobacter sp. A5.8]|uniref:GNAT family N-acetyltransferase n=1 Tax=Ancylobacter gelatini TaxID=2919920 RepID=UPI001F4DADA8|nr:GNAT family N-acetyltransferase [Ancylobacter gelatini]MCJ8142773.1 GNAT family N-acetyltransferase [Ancylobacter gelatini]